MEFGKFARKYICSACGRIAKTKPGAPQDEFDYILNDWSKRPEKRQANFCNLGCLQKWIEEQQEEQ